MVMDYGVPLSNAVRSLASSDDLLDELRELESILQAWLRFFISAGVFHTDLRMDNVLLFKKQSSGALAWAGETANSFDQEEHFLSTVSKSLEDKFRTISKDSNVSGAVPNRNVPCHSSHRRY